MFNITVEAVPYKLTRDNVELILKDSKLVIDCTDNITARKLIQDFVRRADIPCLHGALSADGEFARIMWDEDFVADAEEGDGATCEDGEHLPFFATVASFLVVEVQQFLKKGKKRSWQLTPAGITRLT